MFHFHYTRLGIWELQQTLLSSDITQLSNYATLAPLCLAFYELIITFSEEVLAIWRNPVNATTILLLSNRWVILASAFIQLALSTENKYGFLDA
ncbi:hypothetical protein PHLGIDRAFT_118365 [Phlebiopsis gigantea 11061_1 CR5-6]|uniref:DUF6533 domain-containing protein n=1 Tax=Phlebiopsis gigantea (strain 11061_1 CR5-6) TaxID=745531 RepID=A0A0C3RYD8_PHLG1|nr:hypothetical protein PHLGIDRAFT_118365 [Phlebiopsis gigantea 11061_1 CR5-6]